MRSDDLLVAANLDVVTADYSLDLPSRTTARRQQALLHFPSARPSAARSSELRPRGSHVDDPDHQQHNSKAFRHGDLVISSSARPRLGVVIAN